MKLRILGPLSIFINFKKIISLIMLKINKIPIKNDRLSLFLVLKTLVILLSCPSNALAQQQDIVVRVAKLQIDSAQLDSYKAALKEEIETSVRIEKGVLTLYA
jgi:hypothetical protein